MKARTIKGKTLEEIKVSLSESLSDGYRPTLAIIFMSFKLDIEAVCELLNDHGIQIFGATSSGEFISSEIEEESIVIMLLDMHPSHFNLVFLEAGEHSEFEMATQLGEMAKENFANAAFIIASGWSSQIDGEEVIKGIENGFGEGATIFGGMAGDDLSLTGPIAFTHGKSSVTGLVALILDQDKVEVSGVATCGWKPIGITKTVTKSEGNIVYTIDDKPALDLVAKYLGLDLSKKFNNTVFDLGGYYPLQLEREDTAPVMRTTQMGNAEDRSLICAGNVPQGSKVRFSLPPDFDVIDTVVADCTDVKIEQLQNADAVIMFSCISRYLSLGVMTSEEIERVNEVWNAPLIGFFTYGEYGKSKHGKHEFHNNTCCVVALKEKK